MEKVGEDLIYHNAMLNHQVELQKWLDHIVDHTKNPSFVHPVEKETTKKLDVTEMSKAMLLKDI